MNLLQNVGQVDVTAAATATKAFGSPPAVGSLISVQAAAYNGADQGLGTAGVSSAIVHDNQGNNFTCREERHASGGAVAIWDFVVPSAYGSYSVTVAPSGTPNFAISFAVQEWGVPAASPLDQHTSTASTGTSGGSGVTGTTDTACGLFIAAFHASSFGLSHAPTGYTELGYEDVNLGFQSSYKAGSLGGVTTSPAWTWTSNVAFFAAVVTYKDAPVVTGPPVGSLGMMGVGR